MKGAFIQPEMVGTPVFIQCDKNLTRLIVNVLPGIKKFVTKRGTLYCQLWKALYGCVQVSKLWYNKLTKFLREEGYEHSPTDPCIMQKIVGEEVFLLIIYVDNILVLAPKPEIKRLQQAFIKQFRCITMEIGNAHSYLGMQLILEDDCVRVDMRRLLRRCFYLAERMIYFQGGCQVRSCRREGATKVSHNSS